MSYRGESVSNPLASLSSAARGPPFCSYHVTTSYCVSMTEQATAKCCLINLLILYEPKNVAT